MSFSSALSHTQFITFLKDNNIPMDGFLDNVLVLVGYGFCVYRHAPLDGTVDNFDSSGWAIAGGDPLDDMNLSTNLARARNLFSCTVTPALELVGLPIEPPVAAASGAEIPVSQNGRVAWLTIRLQGDTRNVMVNAGRTFGQQQYYDTRGAGPAYTSGPMPGCGSSFGDNIPTGLEQEANALRALVFPASSAMMPGHGYVNLAASFGRLLTMGICGVTPDGRIYVVREAESIVLATLIRSGMAGFSPMGGNNMYHGFRPGTTGGQGPNPAGNTSW